MARKKKPPISDRLAELLSQVDAELKSAGGWATALIYCLDGELRVSPIPGQRDTEKVILSQALMFGILDVTQKIMNLTGKKKC